MYNKSIPKDHGPPAPPPPAPEPVRDLLVAVKYKTLNTARSVTNKFDSKMSKKMGKLNKAIIADQAVTAIGDKIRGVTLETLDHFEKIHKAEMEAKRKEEERRMKDKEYREQKRRQDEEQRRNEEEKEQQEAREIQE